MQSISFPFRGRSEEQIQEWSDDKHRWLKIYFVYAFFDSFIENSDDRTASTVTSRIQNAIDAGSGLHAKGKPTCVIVDEIDGAVGGGDGVSFRLAIQATEEGRKLMNFALNGSLWGDCVKRAL